MSLFDQHLNRLRNSGMLNDFDNKLPFMKIENFTNPNKSENKGLTELRGGGLKSDSKNNPLFVSKTGLGGDSEINKTTNALQSEIHSMAATGVSTKLSGKIESIAPIQEGESKAEKVDLGADKKEEEKENEGNVYEISDFGKEYTKSNSARPIMLVNKKSERKFYGSKSKYQVQTGQRITQNFKRIGETHTMGDNTLVAISKDYYNSQSKK